MKTFRKFLNEENEIKMIEKNNYFSISGNGTAYYTTTIHKQVNFIDLKNKYKKIVKYCKENGIRIKRAKEGYNYIITLENEYNENYNKYIKLVKEVIDEYKQFYKSGKLSKVYVDSEIEKEYQKLVKKQWEINPYLYRSAVIPQVEQYNFGLDKIIDKIENKNFSNYESINL